MGRFALKAQRLYSRRVQSELAEPATKSTEQMAEKTVLGALLAIAFSHTLNDTMQSLIPAIYPLVKESFHLNFTQVGLITLTFQLTASILQPLVGIYTDRKPHPYSLPVGMCFTLVGLILLSMAGAYAFVLIAVGMVGIGSSVFHPEASRVAHMAAGNRHGFAQSLFQMGGNAGTSLGPLLAALIIGSEQSHVAWFSIAALMAIFTLWRIGGWYKANMFRLHRKPKDGSHHAAAALSRGKVGFSLAILVALMFSKFFYIASMASYYTFYLIDKFHLSIHDAQMYLFLFLAAGAIGTFVGGPVGDRLGRKFVIWTSILGVTPFTLLLPHLSLFWTAAVSVMVGLLLSSAFPAILVYAQELLPGKVGMVAGLFFGLAFGMGGLGSAILGHLADLTNIRFVFLVCSFLPLIGLLTGFLPTLDKKS
jgi:FSR family fosmidomycin resistance protein-like MFS transporter